MRRKYSVMCSVVGLFLLFGFSASSQAASGVDAVVIFATNSVRMDMNTEVLSGDIVVNDFSNGPTLQAGFELTIKKNVAIAGAIRADSIKLFKGVTAGTIECNDGTGVTCGGLTLPVFLQEELPEARTPYLGTDAVDVAVGPGETVVLHAGSYLDITISEGGTLVFTGGIYNIGSILPASTKGTGCAFSPCRSMEFLAPSEVKILGPFDIGDTAFVGPGTGSTAAASNIILYVFGTNLEPEDPASDPPAARVGKDSRVEANFWVPNGTLVLKKNLTATGAFWGRDVDIDKDGEFRLASFFNLPPTADGQSVFTTGVTSVDITLTGSDPENETLEFTIVSGPSNGSLSGLTQHPPSSATVTYTANQIGDLPDEFTFRVTDPNGGFDEAVVDINPSDTTPDPTYSDTVIGKDMSVEAVTGSDMSIILSGVADVEDPGAVGDLEFSIVSGPTLGTVSSPSKESPTSASVVYTAGSVPGSDSFDFQVCGDLNGNGGTNDPGECDIATVSIALEVYTPPTPPVAEDLKVTTVVNTPVEINLSDPAGDPRQRDDKRSKSLVDKSPVAVTKQNELPNLKVMHFSAPACAVLDEQIGAQVELTITNDGAAPIPAGTGASIGFYTSLDTGISIEDRLLAGGRENLATQLPDGLAIGESGQIQLFFGARIAGTLPDSNPPLGSAYIGVVVDEDFNVGQSIAESNEDDNTAFLPIEVLPVGAQCPPSAQPDLVVSSLTHDPATPDTETQIEFTAVVENIGDASADPSTLSFKIGGESPDSPDALFPISQLAPGDTEAIVRYETLSVAQNYLNTAVADYDQDVAESDESNNTTIDTFTVTDAVETTRLTATIVTFPLFGTLFDSSGLQISPQSILPDTTVSYAPDEGSTETDSFTYMLTDHSTGLSSAVAQVDLRIFEARPSVDLCVAVGREPGCHP